MGVSVSPRWRNYLLEMWRFFMNFDPERDGQTTVTYGHHFLIWHTIGRAIKKINGGIAANNDGPSCG